MSFDIEGFVSRHFLDYVISDDDIQVDCPFCEQRIGKIDTKHHLGINLYKPMVHCFRCEYGADWMRLVMDITGLPYAQALGELYVKPHMTEWAARMRDLQQIAITPADRVEMPAGFMLLNRKVRSMAMQKAIAYMEKRGFSIKLCRRYGLGVAESIPLRIIIPVEDDYWQGRRYASWLTPKYLNPKSKSRSFLFNSQALQNYNEIVICEGAFSAMAVGDNAIALISKSPTPERVDRIVACSADRFIIALEPEGGYETMMPLADKLHRNGKEVIIWKYAIGDPADPNGRFTEYLYTLRNVISMKMENGR
jgi:hypothetical protein